MGRVTLEQVEEALNTGGVILCIKLPPVSKKNDLEIHYIRGRPTIGHSVEFKRWHNEAVRQLQQVWGSLPPIEGPLNAAITSYRAKGQTGDASNLYQGPEDALQAARVIRNDYQIESHDGSRRARDPENPRVEIRLTRPRND